MQPQAIRKPLNSFEDVQTFLDGLGLFSMNLGLERVKKAIKLLNLRFSCPIVQVVGTNGKGSTATFLHSIAMAHGFKAGLFTSPHFISPLERIRLNNKPLPKNSWANFANQALELVPDLTYFELLTVISLLAFTFAEPDILIYEAGLGGKNDATSALEADLLCVTPIDFDHKTQLGNSLELIATEKSGAMHKDMFAVVSACQSNEVFRILQERTKELNIPFYSYHCMELFPARALIQSYDPNDLGLKGIHQSNNAQLALIAWHLLCEKNNWILEAKAVAKGLKNAFIAGRFQKIVKEGMGTIILDGAHNAHGVKSLVNSLVFEKITPKALIFSCLENKEPKELIEIIEKFIASLSVNIPIFLTPIVDNPNAMPIKKLANLFQNSEQLLLCDNFSDALHSSTSCANNDNPVVVCGSLYLLAEYFKLFPQDLKLDF